MIHTDGIPTIAWAKLHHISQAELEEELWDEPWPGMEAEFEDLRLTDSELETLDTNGAEWDWILQHRLQEELER